MYAMDIFVGLQPQVDESVIRSCFLTVVPIFGEFNRACADPVLPHEFSPHYFVCVFAPVLLSFLLVSFSNCLYPPACFFLTQMKCLFCGNSDGGCVDNIRGSKLFFIQLRSKFEQYSVLI